MAVEGTPGRAQINARASFVDCHRILVPSEQPVPGAIPIWPDVAGDSHRDRSGEGARVLSRTICKQKGGRVSRRQTSAGSIFWGLTLVSIGALLLARNLGYAIPIWGPLAKYWPL